jgi:hypothetical protein
MANLWNGIHSLNSSKLKWIEQIGCASDSSGGTPVKIHSPHQFSPCNGPAGGRNEFKERQRRLKEARMQGRISPGPKSQILQGIPQQEEVKKRERRGGEDLHIF